MIIKSGKDNEMDKLFVYIEHGGTFVKAGELTREDGRVTYRYLPEFLEWEDRFPISVNLPLSDKSFDENKTAIFFGGLLPEGFTRKSVAGNIRVDENDYFSILKALGCECLGAICIVDSEDNIPTPEYVKIQNGEIVSLASEGASEAASVMVKTHVSLTGASGKVGLYYNDKSGDWYLPNGTAPSTHIVKQSHVRLKRIVVNEQLSLLTAKKLGIDVPESFIINLGSGDDSEILYATKRYDRVIPSDYRVLGESGVYTPRIINGQEAPYRLHQEDFAMAMGIQSKDKYEIRGEEYLLHAFDLVRNYAAQPIKDTTKLWDYYLFHYFIGNTDCHIKNLSFLYSGNFKQRKLAPLYDTISTVIYESSTREMSVSIDGKYNIDEINRVSFKNMAAKLHLGQKWAMEAYDNMADNFENAIKEASYELKEQGLKDANEMKDKILTERKIW